MFPCYIIRMVVFLFLHIVFVISDSRSLTEILKEYDTLKKEHLIHRFVRRSVGNGVVSFGREIHFKSLGR